MFSEESLADLRTDTLDKIREGFRLGFAKSEIDFRIRQMHRHEVMTMVIEGKIKIANYPKYVVQLDEIVTAAWENFDNLPRPSAN